MIDLKRFCGRTNGTLAALFGEQSLYVVGCKSPAILGYAGAARSSSCFRNIFGALWIVYLPAVQYLACCLAVIFFPLLRSRAVAMRVFGSPLTNRRCLVSGARGEPSATPINRALNAMAVRHEPLIRMPVLAWCASRVVALTGLLGCDTRRMPWLLGLVGHRVFDRTRRANSGGCVSLRKVSISARLSGMVKSFACDLRGFALRHSVQGSTPPVSNIFIVARAA